VSELSTELSELLPPSLTIETLESAESEIAPELLHPEIYFQLGNSETSLALSSRISAENYFGAHYKGGHLILPNDWDAYALQLSQNATYNPFHIAELLKNTAGLTATETDFELNAPPQLQAGVQKHFAETPHIKIGIALEGQNPEELLAIVSATLALDLRLKIYLLGTVKDRRISSSLLETIPDKTRVVELTGRLGLRETAALAQACDIVIAPPGLISTLAAGFGTFCITLDSTAGEANHHYPYGHGHLVVQRNRESFTTEQFGFFVSELVTHTILGDEGNIPNQQNWQNYFDTRVNAWLTKVRVYITQRVQHQLSDGTTRTDLKLHPLIYTGATAADCLRSFYRLLWEQTLNGFNTTTHELDVLENQSITVLASLLTPMEQLCELMLFGQKYTSLIAGDVAKGNVENAKLNSARLQEVDDLIRVFSNTHPYLAPICHFLFSKHAQGRSTAISDIAAELSSAYRGSQLQVLILLDLYKSLFQNTYDQETRSLHV
jgi:hypothetical protein